MANRPHSLTLQQRLILDQFRHTRGAACSMARLVMALYGDRPDGGPDAPERSIRVQLCQIRKWLQPRGVRLLSIGSGSGTVGWMIDPADLGRLEEAWAGLLHMDIEIARARLGD